MALHKQIIVIPARYESVRFSGKMLATILGKSLIQHTFENAKRSKLVKNILITSDDSRILNHAKDFGAQVVKTPKSTPNGTTRVFQALEKAKITTKEAIVINVQGDEPILNPKSIDKLFSLLENDPKIKMATLVTPIKDQKSLEDSSVVKCVFDKNLDALYFSRSSIPFMKEKTQAYQHVGVYAFRFSFLETYCKLSASPMQKAEDLEQLKVLEHGYKIKVIVDKSPAIGVDEPKDLKKVEKYLCR
ncbi:MAG: 8-amino-3,8-dideoxy-manno-octulosonate cytidylyltransferase [Chlamydiae bacterium]|nr:8-amino-3,8-dideoxy-manno-octulosonate cytidylyltransferase [Chlamydiota bacterium]